MGDDAVGARVRRALDDGAAARHDGDVGTRHRQGRAHQSARRRRQLDVFVAGRLRDRHGDVERHQRAALARQQDTARRGARRSVGRGAPIGDRQRPATEPGRAHEQRRRQRHVDPAVVEHVDGELGGPGGQPLPCRQLVGGLGDGRPGRRRRRRRRPRVGLLAELQIVGDGERHPAVAGGERRGTTCAPAVAACATASTAAHRIRIRMGSPSSAGQAR